MAMSGASIVILHRFESKVGFRQNPACPMARIGLVSATMNRRPINALLWGNSVALAWMWGLGLFFSVQITFMFGLQGLLLFAIPNALGLVLFGFLTQIVAKRHAGGPDSLARFFDKFSKPFRLILYIYQVVAITLTVFALSKYLFKAIDIPLLTDQMKPLYLIMVVFVVLAAGCLFGEEFGIRRIKFGHLAMGLGLWICVGVIFWSLNPSMDFKALSWTAVLVSPNSNFLLLALEKF